MPQQDEFEFNQIQAEVWQGSVILHLGTKKTGKTTYTSKFIKKWLKKGKGVLVYDINNHANFKDVRRIEINDIDYWNNKGIVKINDIHIWELIAKIVERVRNTLLVFDDATPYFKGNLPIIVEEMLLQSRNHCNDFFINMHDFRSPAPALFSFSDFMILRDTDEDWDDLPSKCLKPKLYGKYLRDIQEENSILHPKKAGKQVPQLAYREIDRGLPYVKKIIRKIDGTTL